MSAGAINCADADVLAALRKVIGRTAHFTTAAWVANEAGCSSQAATASLRRLVDAGLVESERLQGRRQYRPLPVQPVEDGGERA